MPDDAAPTAATGPGLDDLERRLSAFEASTRRLGHTVGTLDDPGHTSPPRPATRRLSDPGLLRGEEISGLRPAVQQPVTGALTARNRSASAGSPGFTSKIGKPSIPLAPLPSAAPSAPPAARVPWRLLALGAGVALVLALAALPRLFPVLNNASAWAVEQRIDSTTTGQVEAVPVRVGDQVEAGQELARIAGAICVATVDGTITRLLVTPGMRIAAGEPVADLATPNSVRIIAALTGGLTTEIGHRVRITLLGERRIVDGTIERILAAGADGPWHGSGQPPARLVIVVDPAPQPVQLGQGARVTLLGAPTAGRQLLAALRQALPW